MNLFCGPAADRVADVQEHLQQADDAGVMEFDFGIADRTDSHGQSQPLQQGKVHRDMEALSHLVHGEEGIVVLVEADTRPVQFLLDEGMAVEPVGGVEREEPGLIPDVEVVMCEAAPLGRENAMVGVLGGIVRHGDAERAAQFR